MSDLDPRLFNLPASYLNAWCLSHPEQPVVESIAVLAQHAGCSVKHMTQILNEERELQVSHARGLAVGLGLDEAGAAHLLNITALRHADAEASERLIQQIRAAQADVLGLPWEAASSQVEERQPRPGARWCRCAPTSSGPRSRAAFCPSRRGWWSCLSRKNPGLRRPGTG